MNAPFVPSKKSPPMNNSNSSLFSFSRLTGFAAVALAGLTFGVSHARATGLVMDTGTLSIAPTGQLNLQDNDLIVRSATLAAITAYIQTGLYNGPGGYWDGPGINSSVAAADATTVTAIGVLDNALLGATAFPYLADYSPAPGSHATVGTEILVKFTYFGDADLNGVVDDGVDYNQFLAGLTGGGVGWLFGDFDYSGGPTDDGSDYNQFLLGLTGQGAPLVSQGSVVSASPVPEPSVIGLLLIGFTGALSRRSKAGRPQN